MAIASLFVAAHTTSAQTKAGKDPVAVQLTASKVTSKNGAEKLAPAEQAKPGDTLQYEAVYRNESSRSVENLQATLPIPQGVEFVPGTAKPAAPQASLDGKTFAPIPLKRTVTTADGKTQEQDVPTSEYRALRWTFPQLEAGKSLSVTARTRVLSATAAR
jgi:uncharacterized repeat protein (TIGR01451 family)